LRGRPIPVISDQGKISNRSKTNVLRGSLALALGSICISLFMTKSPFMTKTTDHGAAFAESATSSLPGGPKVALASKEAGSELASLAGDHDASGSQLKLEQWHAGAPRDPPVTAIGQSEGKVVERTELVKSTNTPEQELLDRTRSAESFASLPKGSSGTSTPQLKSGFVGLWASDARACEFRPGRGSDLRTVIGERGARAGGNSCAFKEKKQIANSEWEMRASCADGSERWESRVRLSISNNKLKWSGQRGTQIYVRCT
jgi:hypothetical protein